MRDADVRAAVRLWLTAQHEGDADTRIVEEMGVWSGSARIDIAVINGELAGYELKSDRDTLERLPFQKMIYNHVFDRLTLVVGQKHARGVKRHVPKWWGITVATGSGGGVDLDVLREPGQNPKPSPEIIAQLLWKDEAISVLDRWGLADGWKSKRVKDLHRRLATELEFDDLKREVRGTLKARSMWLGKVQPHAFNVSADANLNPFL